MKTIIAVDPGVSGGIAIICGANVTAVPFTSEQAAQALLWGFSLHNPDTMKLDIVCYMELVGGFIKGKEDKQPGSAMFVFGKNYGYMQGLLAGYGIRVELVRPQVWQKVLGRLNCKGPERKRAIKEVVAPWYPDLKVTLAVCDALGLLKYAIAAENAGPKPEPVAKTKKPKLPIDRAAIQAEANNAALARVEGLSYKEQSAEAMEWCRLNMYPIPKRKTPEFSAMFNYWYNLAINGDA